MSRRARTYGRGSIEHRGPHFFIRFHDVKQDGTHRRWREGPFASREDAEAYRARGERLTADQSTDTADYLEQWSRRFEAEARLDQRESSAVSSCRHVRLHLAPHLRGIRLGDIRPSDLNTLWRQLIENGLARKTVYNIRSTLSVALRVAVSDRILSSNPVRDSHLPKRHRGFAPKETAGRDRVVDEAKYRVLRDWLRAADTHWAPPTLLIGETGLRRGEALGVTWKSIDFRAGTLTVEHQVVQLDTGEVVLRPVKTQAANRTISLTNNALELLHELRKEEVRKGYLTPTSRLVFHEPGSSAPLNPESFSQWFRKQLRPAVTVLPPRFSLHSLRHSHASILLDNGVSESTVARRLGHSSPVVTISLYSHATKLADQAAAAAWSRLHA